MKKTIQILVALLALQVLIALGLHFGGGSELAEVAPSGEPLLAADIAQIDRIAIQGTDPTGGTGSIELKKVEGKWKLPDGNDADAAKVKQLLDKLKGIKLGAPVATTQGAAARFQLEDKNNLRRIELGAGGKPVTTIYFGKRIGTRQMHLRRADQQAVYTANFTIFDAPYKGVEWQPSGLPATPPATPAPNAPAMPGLTP